MVQFRNCAQCLINLSTLARIVTNALYLQSPINEYMSNDQKKIGVT